MPVFGVNDRRQPAVSVISTGTKWSGEISLRNGTSCIVAGDFSTQSINRTQTICRQNRHAAPLNDSRGGLHLCHSASFRDACTQPAVSVISTGTKWSGEISLRNGTSCIVAGDFSTQSINRTQTICRQNRHAAPLNDSRGGLHLCHSASFRDACTQLAAPVISTGAGQPPIGKPLIGQAGGQLRLTWRLYAESPQSGEIPLRNGTSLMTAGDFPTQSINRG